MTVISVIVPLHNHATTVVDTITSVLHQADLGDERVEIVVIDDGSTDGGPELVARTFATQLHAGELVLLRHDSCRRAAAARNTGFRACTGNLLVFLDSDDVLPEGRFRAQIDALAANPEMGIVAGMLDEFAEPGWDGRAVSGPVATRMVGTMMIRRQAFERVGLFDETLPAREVVEWGARLSRSDVQVLDTTEVVLHRRLHSGNHGMVHSPTMSAAALLQTMRAHLQAKRSE